MASYTEFLNLLKKDGIADAQDTFNIQTMLNDNWDKIDAFAKGSYASGSYTGNGNAGDSAANVVTLPFANPKAFIVIMDGANETTAYSFLGVWVEGAGQMRVLGGNNNSVYNNVSISGNSISWYNAQGLSATAKQYAQMNGSGKPYRWLALG